MNENQKTSHPAQSAQQSDEQRALAILKNFTLKSMSARERTKLMGMVTQLHALHQQVVGGDASAFEAMIDNSYALMARFVEEDQSQIDALEFEDLGICFGYLVEQISKKKA